MIKNGKRIVLEASEGITFRVQEGKEGIVIKAIIEDTMSSNSNDNYKNPYIPKGYVHLEGTWDTGFVIQNEADGSEFVWIPVGYLDADGTLDGEYFNEKLGRMNFYNSDFSKSGYHEEVDADFVESVKEYGGYYIARYHAFKEKGKLVFKKGKPPWVNINYTNAETVAANYAKNSKEIVSKITSGTAFDSMLRWILKSGKRTHDEVVKDSTSWGNYWNAHNSPRKVMPTGSSENWCTLNIYDIAGNVDEWTSERYGVSYRVLRGGYYNNYGSYWTAACRDYDVPVNHYHGTSFRAMLYKKKR